MNQLAQCNQAMSQNYMSTGYWTEYPRREMTREDLGLPPKEVRIWSSKDWERQKSPYKFWLGADA